MKNAPAKKRAWWPYFFIVPVILLLAAMAIPNYVKARTHASPNACVNNLRQIDGAKEQWALENKKPRGALVTPADGPAVNAYIKGGDPRCPSGGSYTYGPIGDSPTCSISGHTL